MVAQARARSSGGQPRLRDSAESLARSLGSAPDERRYDISIVFQTSAESVGDGVQLVPGMIGAPYFPSTISTCWVVESAGVLRRISQGKPFF